MSIPSPENNYPPQTPPYGDPSGITQDDKTMAMLAYLLGIFTGFIGPLILWAIKKDQSKFVAFHAFQSGRMVRHPGAWPIRPAADRQLMLAPLARPQEKRSCGFFTVWGIL